MGPLADPSDRFPSLTCSPGGFVRNEDTVAQTPTGDGSCPGSDGLRSPAPTPLCSEHGDRA